MVLQSFPQMPSASSVLSVYASMTTSIMLFRTMFDQLVPPQARTYIINGVKYYWKPKKTSKLTLVIEEQDSFGDPTNDMFYAAETYLIRMTPDSNRLRITKSMNDDQINVNLGESVEMVDLFEEVPITWNYSSTKEKTKDDGESVTVERKFIELKFDKKYKDVIIASYLPSIINKYQEFKNQKKVVQLHNLKSFRRPQTAKLAHPSTFDTLAMDPELKKSIIDDLDLFLKRRDYYNKVGKAWKRGYLLYGPPGTGKSSLIAAMANYLKFDIYDLQLSNVQDDSSLKDILLSTSNRSILVIEDIDCSAKLPNRKIINAKTKERCHDDPKFSLSGLLNFIDGLWSCCGDERIIIFTTNHKERLDPALLRPGRMDVHIHMSYLTFGGFKTLAANYLNIHDHHWRFREIKELIECKKVTPAQVAEELMKSDNAEVVLEGLMNFLKRKKNDADETVEVVDIDEDNEVPEAKRTKLDHDLRIESSNDEGSEFDEEDC